MFVANQRNMREITDKIIKKVREFTLPDIIFGIEQTGFSGVTPVMNNEMNLLGFQLLGKPRFGSGGLILMNNALACRSIQNAGEAFKLRSLFVAGFLRAEILYSTAQCRFDFAIFLPISFCGLHSLGRRFVCRQSFLLCSKFKKTNITGS